MVAAGLMFRFRGRIKCFDVASMEVFPHMFLFFTQVTSCARETTPPWNVQVVGDQEITWKLTSVNEWEASIEATTTIFMGEAVQILRKS